MLSLRISTGALTEAPAKTVLLLAAAQRAAPSKPALSLVMTCTGMLSRSGRNLPFSRKARMNNGPVSLGKNLRRDSAAEKDSAGGHRLQREIARLCAVNRDPQI